LGQGRLVEVLQEKYKNTFRSVLPKDMKGNPVYPQDKSDILMPTIGKDLNLYRDARAMHDYIRIMTSSLTPMQRGFQNLSLNLAATMEQKGFWGSGVLSRALYGINEPGLTPTA